MNQIFHSKLRCLQETECAFTNLNYISQISCENSCISEIYFPKKKNIKILVKYCRFVSSINFENRLICYISEHCFLNHWRETDISKSGTSNL